MPSPLFSRYSQGENRVTASILAVFERISFALVERILQILCEETNISLLQIENQIVIKGADSIPDGVIRASFAYWIETKVVQNSVSLDQLNRHLESIEKEEAKFTKKKLLVLTPDFEKPKVMESLNPDLVIWASFNDLYSAIVEITATDESWLSSNFSLPSEQERFLLRELVQMLIAERLINNGKSDAVLIVPARAAIGDYRNFSIYVCQPARSFQRIEYIGFYHNGIIDRCIAKILYEPIEEVSLTKEALEEANLTPGVQALAPEVKTLLHELVDKLEAAGRDIGGTNKVFFLSSSDSPDTIKLKQDIKNDLRNASGRPYAFTQGQRYVPMSALLKNPATTTELLKG
jgi:hypothetical protein